MTGAGAPAVARPPQAAGRAGPVRGRVPGRLLRLELRRNVMLWLVPVAAALFVYNGYREIMALPPLWNLRAMTLQTRTLLDFSMPVIGAAAWMGSRESRRGVTDLLEITARPRWARQLAVWAATTCWAMLGYACCVGVVYVLTARQASWGGPLWWPAVVGAAGIPALSALGFAAGAVFPSRFTTPLVAIAGFFGLGYGTQAAQGDHSYWMVSPLINDAPGLGTDSGVATFYHYLPDLSIAQVMFLAGLTAAVLGGLGWPAGSGGRWLRRSAAVITVAGLAAAGTAVGLTGTGRLDPHGMIAIPALHDAANDQPAPYTAVCGHTAIPVCLNPAYASYLPAVTAVLGRELGQLAGLPGAPARLTQAAQVYQQGRGNGVGINMHTPPASGGSEVFFLPDPLPGEMGGTTAGLDAYLKLSTGLQIVAGVIGSPSRSPGLPAIADPAQQAVISVLSGIRTPSLRALQNNDPGELGPFGSLLPAPGSPAYAAAKRFSALTPAARHAWLVQHLAALRAGHITPAQLP